MRRQIDQIQREGNQASGDEIKQLNTQVRDWMSRAMKS